MLFPSSINLALARCAYQLVSRSRALIGQSDLARARRNGVSWELDLREGLDLTLYVTGYFQAHVVRAMRGLVMAGDTALDLGANMGAMTLHLARFVGDQGKVIAVEPTAGPFQRLERNLALNPHLARHVTARKVYLAAQPADVAPDHLPSSWRVSDRYESAHPVHGGVPQTTSGAPVLTLDALVQEHQCERLDFIKLDVDGAEAGIIRGGHRAISQHLPTMLVEIAPYALKEAGYEPHEPLQLLEDMSYQFETLRGRPIRDTKRWVDQIPEGYSVDVVARAKGV